MPTAILVRRSDPPSSATGTLISSFGVGGAEPSSNEDVAGPSQASITQVDVGRRSGRSKRPTEKARLEAAARDARSRALAARKSTSSKPRASQRRSASTSARQPQTHVQQNPVRPTQTQHPSSPDDGNAQSSALVLAAPRVEDVQPESVAKKPTTADNFSRRSRKEQARQCNFESHESVNKWFPPYKGKGQFNCPYSLIAQARSCEGKATVVREWRALSHNQQQDKMEQVFAESAEIAASQKAAAAEKKQRERDAKNVAARKRGAKRMVKVGPRRRRSGPRAATS
ncbi:hypothetical protein ACHAWF_016527 [Thalassiosira exigua]